MANEPVMWVRSQHKGAFRRPRVWDEKKQRYVQPVDEFDRPLIERVPAKGYVGNDLANMRPMPGNRSVTFLRADGNIVDVPLTTGASLPVRENEYRSDRLRKARYFGWLPVGCCPLREVVKGLSKQHLLAREAREGEPCPDHELGGENPPCPHYLAELKARRAKSVIENRKVNLSYKDDEAKRTEALTTLVEHLVDKRDTAVLVAEAAPQKDSGKK
jgi:hypothetical protein